MRLSRMRRMTRALVVLSLGGVAASATYAHAASGAVERARAGGHGAKAISGYTVSDVRYTLDPEDPARYGSVEFDLDAPARSVRARVSSSSDHSSCEGAAPGRWRCPVDDRVADADELSVIAAG